MKKKARRQLLSRKQKTIRNLILTALGLVLLWRGLGAPLPTMEQEFRRLERARLMEPSEIVLATGKTGNLRAVDGTELKLEYPKAAGVCGDRVIMADVERDRVWSFPLEDGPTPVPLFTAPIYHVDVPRAVSAGTPLLFLRIPEETARASLEVRAGNWSGRWAGDGVDLGGGRWFFDTSGAELYYGMQRIGETYRLSLYDISGELLLEQQGDIPAYDDL